MAERWRGKSKKGSDLTAAALKVWKVHVDVDETSIKEFLHNYTIQTKRVEGASGTVLVDFVERRAQARLRQCMEAQWKPHSPDECPAKRDDGTCWEGHGALILILKDRQQGISTGIQGLIWERLLRGGGGNAAVVSHKDEATEILFETLNHFKGQMPDGAYAVFGEPWGTKPSERPGVERSNVRQIKLRLGQHLTSSARVYTAGDKALGRGGALRWLHISEFPWWERGKDAVGGLIESCDDSPGNFIIFESTANGREQFYENWLKGMQGLNEYATLFYSWLSHPLKRRKLPRQKENKEAFRRSIGKDTRYGIEEELNLLEHGATDEQLWWRRKKIDSVEIGGDLDVFKREHPMSWREAFQTSTHSVYPLQILEAWEALGRQMDMDAWVGDLAWKGEDVVFRENRLGRWRIYREPQVGSVYGFGCDPASGKVVQYDGRTEADFAAMLFRSVLNKKIAAIYHAHEEPELLALEVAKGSAFYGDAKGFIERNDEYGGTVIRTLIDAGKEEILLAQERVVPTTTGKMQTTELGFVPRNASKAAAVDLSKTWVYELGFPKKGVEPEIPHCLLDEMTRFERLLPKRPSSVRARTRLGARMGHDDLVSADYLCHEALKILEWEVAKLSKVRPKRTDQDLYFELLAKAAEPSRARGYDKSLGTGF